MAELDTITGAHHGTAGAMAHDDDQFGARNHGPKLEASAALLESVFTFPTAVAPSMA